MTRLTVQTLNFIFEFIGAGSTRANIIAAAVKNRKRLVFFHRRPVSADRSCRDSNTMKVLIHFLLVASCLTISIGDALLLNRTDFINDPHVSTLRPVLETFHPAVRIWLNGVIGDRLAVANGFTKIIAGGGKPFPLLRMFFRSRLVRWIAFLAFLKVAFSLFVIVILPNIYFYAMTQMRE